jgi:hypothetical protein
MPGLTSLTVATFLPSLSALGKGTAMGLRMLLLHGAGSRRTSRDRSARRTKPLTRPVWVILCVATFLAAFQLPAAGTGSARHESSVSARRHWGPPLEKQGAAPASLMLASKHPYHPKTPPSPSASSVASPQTSVVSGHSSVQPLDTTLSVYPGAVTTWAGNGTNATVDGNGTSAGTVWFSV